MDVTWLLELGSRKMAARDADAKSLRGSCAGLGFGKLFSGVTWKDSLTSDQ